MVEGEKKAMMARVGGCRQLPHVSSRILDPYRVGGLNFVGTTCYCWFNARSLFGGEANAYTRERVQMI